MGTDGLEFLRLPPPPPPHSRVRGATHVPILTGGSGREEVERFLRDHFIGHWPADVEVKPLSRTVGADPCC
jgi:hypothetical protein